MEQQKQPTPMSLRRKFLLAAAGALGVAVVGLLVKYYEPRILAYLNPPKSSVVKAVTPVDAAEAIAHDLKMQGEDAPLCRYLVLAHLCDPAILDSERTQAQDAIKRALTWASPPGKACVPHPLDKDWSILRIKIADIGCEPADWLEILKVYPYGYNADVNQTRLHAAQDRIRKAIPDTPYVRGDWFAAHVHKFDFAKKNGREMPPEMTRYTTDYVVQPITLKIAAREVGYLNPDDVKAKIKAEPALQGNHGLAPLLKGGEVTRSSWESQRFGTSPFQALLHSLDIGSPANN